MEYPARPPSLRELSNVALAPARCADDVPVLGALIVLLLT